MSRSTPWGANIAKAVSGDPYVNLPGDGARGDSCGQALVKAGLDWTVELEPVFTLGGLKVDGKRAVVRQSDGYALGVVGGSYSPLQNVEVAAFADDLASAGATGISGVGSLDGGRRVYAVVDFGTYRPDGFGGGEVVNLSQVVWTRHDGGGALTAGLFPLRLACTNGLRALIPNLVRQVKIRHTVNADGRLAEARKMLGLTTQAIDAMDSQIRRLIETTVTDEQFYGIIEQLMPVDEDMPAGTQTRRLNARGEMEMLFAEAANLKGVGGTAYAAFNAVAEWEQWVRPIRGGRSREETQMRAITSTSQTMADRVLAVLS